MHLLLILRLKIFRVKWFTYLIIAENQMFCWFSTVVLRDHSAVGIWRSCARIIRNSSNGTLQVIVVGPEDAKAFASYWQNHDLPFIGLPDPKASVLKLYGQEVNLFKLGRMPAQVIVDRDWRGTFCTLWS